jgi:hypothetical protein
MAVRFYNDPSEYVDSATTVGARIVRLNAIIDALETAALKNAGTANLSDYSFDSGQSKIYARYNTPKQIADAIEAYSKIVERLSNKLQGRKMILRDHNAIIRSDNGI